MVKDEDVFFLCERDGQVPLEGHHGFGLYYHDCRFLNGYEFALAGQRPKPLVAAPRKGCTALLELISPEFIEKTGQKISQQDIAITWQRLIDASRHMLHDRITFQNYSSETVTFPISLSFQADFKDLFQVRGMLPDERGKLHKPRWDGNVLSFRYDGLDDVFRSLHVHFSPEPDDTEETTAQFQVKLPPRTNKTYQISAVLAESSHEEDVEVKSPSPVDANEVEAHQQAASDRWLQEQTQFHSDSRSLNEIMDRSLRDLRLLRSRIQGEEFFAGGVPWFVTLFGRDSIISAMQTLAYEPGIAEQTLRLLAHYQAADVSEWRDEQPGKILHELRLGELAHLGEIPQTPYYGSIDSTPLWLILLARHAAWTGTLELFRELRDNVERALTWMTEYGDLNGDGYLAYDSTSKKGLINQGWKDSGDGIVNADGSLAKPPIALVEVQGYAYQARRSLADLYERDGDPRRAAQLRKEADALREQFNRDFWLADQEFYALALQKRKRPAAVISSNPGQALWSGIVDPDKAGKVVEQCMTDDMFSGWGIRTLSAHEQAYDPIAYHRGTVWPHDNSLIAAGFRRYGFDAAALRVFEGITAAASHFGGYRLPEVFSGFTREEFGVPVRYAVACHPQAWASGATPYLLETLLGLTPEAFDHRLRIVRPMLPETVGQVQLRQLRVGSARLDLQFQRADNGKIDVKVLKQEGALEVRIEPMKEE